MSTDYFDLREIGGAELLEHYPDRGLIPDSSWYNAILKIETDANGLLGKLRSFEIATQGFMAVLSANADGLRILVSLEQLAIFIPWPDMAVSAERSIPATVVRLRAAALPSATLVFHLDDTAADDLFQGILTPLPQREPPRRLFHIKPWALTGLVTVMLALSGYLASLKLAELAFFVAVVIAAGGVWLGLVLLKPFLEET